eukprot:scaffold95988_cov17-Tisochrysis_lutea.AAC.1
MPEIGSVHNARNWLSAQLRKLPENASAFCCVLARRCAEVGKQVHEAWYEMAPVCPQLYLYSASDTLANPHDVERYMQIQGWDKQSEVLTEDLLQLQSCFPIEEELDGLEHLGGTRCFGEVTSSGRQTLPGDCHQGKAAAAFPCPVPSRTQSRTQSLCWHASRGVEVSSYKWQDSGHCEHYRRYPHDYAFQISQFAKHALRDW